MALPHFIFTTMFDPADDHRPWHVVKVYQDGNPIQIDQFKTEDEADDLIDDLIALERVFSSFKEILK